MWICRTAQYYSTDTPEGFEVYGLTAVDLKTIRLAIDTFDGGEVPLLQSTKDAYQKFLKSSTSEHGCMRDEEWGEQSAWVHVRQEDVLRMKFQFPAPPSNHCETADDDEEDLYGYFGDEA
ncbi:hypothetical protein FOBRF1_009232 [Fusarium oxysporum]